MQQVDENSFEAEVVKSDKPVVVDAYADWCGPCKMLAPVFEQVAGQMGDKVKFVKLDVDANANVASNQEVRSLPTMIIFKDGKEVARHSGLMPADALSEWIEKSVQ